jgi:dCMP deaminase
MRQRDLKMLKMAQNYAEIGAECAKVKVGAMIVRNQTVIALGANRGSCSGLESCQELGADGRLHCTSTLHAEIDALIAAGLNSLGAEIFVTRYPCEACARAIARAGIWRVVYGRETEVSSKVAEIFNLEGIQLHHYPEFKEADPYVQKQI